MNRLEPIQFNISGHISPEEKQASDYRLLPFEVTEGLDRIEVEYAFSEDEPGGLWQEAGNILDIGLFDSRGSEFLTAKGFRGWSGSARRAFFVARDEATPGYLPGPMPGGQWEILLGLHRILPKGCDFEVRICCHPDGEERWEASDAGALHVLKGEARWYRGDLHCHTHHSDAKGTLEDLVAAARRQKLDFVAITEHNTVSHLPHLKEHITEELLLIPGEEITNDYGHANVWGIDRWMEFRCRTPDQMSRVLKEAKSRGAVISINHPKEMGPPWTFGMESEFDCIEVWQLAWFMFNDQALALWDRLLKRGHRLTAVGGSDVHQEPFSGELGVITIGTPCTWVYAQELSSDGILSAARAGHVFISENPEGPRIDLSASADGRAAGMGDVLEVSPGSEVLLSCQVKGSRGDRLRICSLEAVVQNAIDADQFEHHWSHRMEDATYFRVEVIGEGEPLQMHALSNPIYL